jgi:integrase/recombinase XerD
LLISKDLTTFHPKLRTCFGGIVSRDQFIKERQYLSNVSPATIEWYTQSLRWLGSESPSTGDLKDFVLRMRAKGLKATACNNRIRAVNAYLKWAGSPLRVPKLKEPELILPTFTLDQVHRLTRYRPKTFYQKRLHMIVLTLLDTGCRISEALGLRIEDCDLDSLLLTVTGKGGKQRRLPFSLELRRVLVRYCADLHRKEFLFSTQRGRKLGRRVVLRDVKVLCKRLGFDPPARTLHAFRHTFAVNYLRRGGGVFHLQRVLGHSSLEMTRRYANLMTEDLQSIHQQVSLLA